MKTIGLLGGMSWESTVGYYREINQGIKARCGGLHSARIVLYGVDFAPIEAMMRAGNWEGVTAALRDGARRVAAAGADMLLICTNTMHRVAETVAQSVEIPLLHIADATAEALVRDQIEKVGLLGTAVTMEEDFYKGRLSTRYGLKVVIPDAADRRLVDDVIFQELCQGTVNPSSKKEFLRIVDRVGAMGAEAVILGCTEIGMLVGAKDTTMPLYDTTLIHAAAAVSLTLEE